MALVQFTAPHSHLATATGLAFSARAIGGAFGSAVLDAIINGTLARTLVKEVGGAAVSAGLAPSSVGPLVTALASGGEASSELSEVQGLNARILQAAQEQRARTYAHAYRLAWASVAPFVVLALVAVALLKGVKELMTEKVEATVEREDGLKTIRDDNTKSNVDEAKEAVENV